MAAAGPNKRTVSGPPTGSGSSVHEKLSKHFGEQVISLPGSVCLNVNNIMGPAIVAFPMIYQQSGWLMPSLVLVIVCVLSGLSATMLCEAMQRIPGNRNFLKRYEFTTTVRHYWGETWYMVSQVLVNLCLQCLNVASIIVAAQVMDELIIALFGHTMGIQYFDGAPCVLLRTSHFSDLHDIGHVVSAGFIVCLLICLPFGMMSLEENMLFQWVSFVLLIASCSLFVCDYVSLPMHPEWVPPVHEGLSSHAQVLGVVIFSFAFVITVPSWVNEKAPAVSTNKSIWWSCLLGMLLKFLVGYLAALTYPNLRNSANVLQVMNDSRMGSHAFHQYTRFAVYLFNFGTIIPGIPIFSVLVRYNLLMGEVTGPKGAFFFSLVLPWAVSALLYRGQGFQNLVNWTALFFQGFVNFTIPALLYLTAIRRYPPASPLLADSSGGGIKAGASLSAVSELVEDEAGYSTASAAERSGGYSAVQTAVGDQADVNAVPPGLARHVCCDTAKAEPEQQAAQGWSDALRRQQAGIAWAVAVVMTVMVVLVLGVDFYYLLVKGKDLVDQ